MSEKKEVVLGQDVHGKNVKMLIPVDPSAGSARGLRMHEVLISLLIRKMGVTFQKPSKHRGGWKDFRFSRKVARSKARAAKAARRLNRLK